jgi:hypothetical protein
VTDGSFVDYKVVEDVERGCQSLSMIEVGERGVKSSRQNWLSPSEIRKIA